MGQTASASAIEADNPKPLEFTYDQAERGNVDIDSDDSSEDNSFSEGPSASENEASPKATRRRAPQPELTDTPDASPKAKTRAKPSPGGRRAKKAAAPSPPVEPTDSKEDEIDKEQANQDLVAYTGIVSENAKNLPLTWRDDPQLAQTVTTLSAHEYAVKADAFIPCDIRIIGATSSLRDRNADVTINEELDIGEAAVEPGLSSGGAICNTLLKALYDFQNGGLGDIVTDEVDDFGIEQNLFSDDEQIDFDDDLGLGGSFQFDQTLDGAHLTWSGLLRKMKDELEDQERDLVPILTTSKKFDLEEPVHLLPPDFDPRQNMKFSLLVGCNYVGQNGALVNSHNDINTMKDYIVNVHGFPEHDDYMTVLLDSKSHKKPTHANILKALQKIALRSRPGDAVFIQFVGHGGRIQDTTAQVDCYDEVFLPSDFNRRGVISEKALIRSFIARMAEDVTVTMLLDSCDSGVIFDMPYSWETRNDFPESPAKLMPNPNFSFMRVLSVVNQMRVTLVDKDPIGDSFDEDEDDFDHLKESRLLKDVLGVGERILDVADDMKGMVRDVAKGAEMEAMKVGEVMKRELRNIIDDEDDRYYSKSRGKSRGRHSYESGSGSYDDEYYDYYEDDKRNDRSYERSYEENYNYESRSQSYEDDASYGYGAASYDSYEERIRRRR